MNTVLKITCTFDGMHIFDVKKWCVMHKNYNKIWSIVKTLNFFFSNVYEESKVKLQNSIAAHSLMF